MAETEAFEKFDNLKLNNLQTVKTDWNQKALIVKERINRRDSAKDFIKSLLVSIIPLITILFLIQVLVYIPTMSAVDWALAEHLVNSIA